MLMMMLMLIIVLVPTAHEERTVADHKMVHVHMYTSSRGSRQPVLHACSEQSFSNSIDSSNSRRASTAVSVIIIS